MYPTYMPLELVEKCSSKVELFLRTNAITLYMNESTLQCMLRSPYGGFGGFIYETTIPGIQCELHISHGSGDLFSVHMIDLNCSFSTDVNKEFVRACDTFAYRDLYGGLRRFIEAAIVEGVDKIRAIGSTSATITQKNELNA